MPAQSEWSLAEPQKLTFEEPVTALSVRVVGGTVNVVGTDAGPVRLELSGIAGPPLLVTHQQGTLTVGYDDLPWQNFLKQQSLKNWFSPKGWQRSVDVTLTVPTGTPVEVAVVGASAVVSGIAAATQVRGVSGDTTLVGLTGAVQADTVSGGLEAQALGGDLCFKSISGDLTLVDCAGEAVEADSVSGNMVVDLAAAGRHPSLDLTTISGDVAIRLPHLVDAEVEANTTTGTVSCAFDDLRVSGMWGAKKVTGRLGAGSGRLKVTTVSGAVALLRRPPSQDGPADSPVQGKVL